MNKKLAGRNRPWTWVPTLYFAEGLPFVAVTTIALIMYKRLGLSNTEITLYTGWLNLPWVLKPLWSPFVDLIGTKRIWIIAMQSLIAAGLAGIAYFIPTTYFVQTTLAFFWLLAFSSATHDIAADGFYMLGLSEGDQSFFVGIRNTFYRLAMIFGQGALIVFAGWMEEGKIFAGTGGNIPFAWSLVFYLLAAVFIGLTLYHNHLLPRPDSDKPRKNATPRELFRNFFATFQSFLRKDNIAVILFFLLCYRLGEAQLVKIASPFLLDDVEVGGLGLSTASVGVIYGTVGLIALLVGGIIGGIAVSRYGLRKTIIPMAIAINLPDILYVWLAAAQPNSEWLAGACVAIEQLGYGFGFTAFTLYLIYAAQGEHRTAHYAIGTGIMALGLMLPGMSSGWLQEQMGYTWFFIWVCICTIPGIFAAFVVRRILPATFGKKYL